MSTIELIVYSYCVCITGYTFLLRSQMKSWKDKYYELKNAELEVKSRALVELFVAYNEAVKQGLGEQKYMMFLNKIYMHLSTTSKKVLETLLK